MHIGIQAIEYYLPEKVLTNEELAKIYPDWPAEKILLKTGIAKRHIASENECASDLAEKAVRGLLKSYNIDPIKIDFILYATQSPDYFLPTTACILQDRLGIPKAAGALDFNLGCSAFVYGLALAKGLILSNIATNVLLITSETYTKYIHPMDKSNRTIFGDGAAATLISENGHSIGDFDLGTDGSGKDYLIVPAGGSRLHQSAETAIETEDDGSIRTKNNLYMNGPEVFNFTIRVVPQSIQNALQKNRLTFADIDLFVFHQANKFMLDFLRKKLKIPEDKFYVNLEDTGNTVSATIPIALKRAEQEGRLKKGDKVLIAGFGVGLSWGSTVLTW